jgi:hypothetical protein
MVATAIGCELIMPPNWEKLTESLVTRPRAAVVWELDHPESASSSHPRSFQAVRQVLVDSVDPSQVFAVVDKPSSLAHLTGETSFFKRMFNHYFIRNYKNGTTDLFSRVLATAWAERPSGIARYFPTHCKVQKLPLQKSEHRGAAVNATESFLSKIGLEARLSARVAQATDELLMNAIFDAACDRTGNYTRQLLDRKAKFELNKLDQVDLEIASCDEYVGVCVSDHFGSINPDVIFKFLSQDFHHTDYRPRRTGPGAGLGLYGIIQNGISLMIVCRPRHQTDAIIFFPNTNFYKEFKQGFQFVSCFIQS